MSVVAKSRCSIRFLPSFTNSYPREYTDSSTIELIQNDDGSYSLRGIDTENYNAKIFDMQLKIGTSYKLGPFHNISDELCNNNGTFRFFLNFEDREQFHRVLQKCFQELYGTVQEPSGVGPGKSSPNNVLNESDSAKSIANGNKILTNIHKLTECIENGNVEDAGQLASKLVKERVQIKAKILNTKLADEEVQIQFQIDGVDLPKNNRNDKYVLNVYRSTTIHELHAMFQYTHNFPVADQYLFVNGHLAHASFTMNDLNIKDNALFILFIHKNEQEDDTTF